MVIVEEVFGIVKRDYPERSGGGSAGIWGAGERGSSPFAPASFIGTSYLFGLILTWMADSDRPGTQLTS
jgi:hypothetical protein